MPVYAAADELLTITDVLALSVDPMFAVDDRHRIVLWNKAIQQLLGYDYDEVAGRTCAKTLCGVDSYGNRYCGEACPVSLMAHRGDPVRQFRLRIRAKDGREVPLDVIVIKFSLPSRRVVLAHVVRPAEAAIEEPRAGAPADPRARGLSSRESEILSLVASGHNAAHIADRLCISRVTARNHIQHIFRKIDVHSKAEAVAFAYRAGFV